MQAVRPIAFVSLALLLGSCSDFRMPESLSTPETDEEMKVNADARDGCAFAGIWQPSGAQSSDDVTTASETIEVIGTRIRGIVDIVTPPPPMGPPDPFCIFCPTSDHTRVLVRGFVEAGGRSAVGTWKVIIASRGLASGRGRVRYELSADGLSYLAAYESDLGQTLIVESRKVRAVPCGGGVQSVQDAFESAPRNEPTPQE